MAGVFLYRFLFKFEGLIFLINVFLISGMGVLAQVGWVLSRWANRSHTLWEYFARILRLPSGVQCENQCVQDVPHNLIYIWLDAKSTGTKLEPDFGLTRQG